ncbi:hypothetical protein J7F01_33830 [Streptomyces sp. ISL-22]|uniref:hypothetical protein n=1 Tax=unclassified Streptomyces TaxID=2593676 RepID=UPI001BEC00A1|nr:MULTISPECIES: hypothetical protein [unclassified Streptomyces]MBT2421272.1 hypothetical protein [Streptomyces sp. ISL-24]MBT2437053.1 hypothetical protein [Streptomyces sp. ISL-22]
MGLLLLAAVVATVTIPELCSELAGDGTEGTLTVSSCETHTKTHYGTHRRSTELQFSCTGNWTADEGKKSSYQDVVVQTSSRFETGAKIPVVQVNDTFEQPQDRDPGDDAAILAICFSLLALGVYCLLTGFGTRGGPGLAASWQRLPATTVTGPLLGGLFALGVLAALVCALVL